MTRKSLSREVESHGRSKETLGVEEVPGEQEREATEKRSREWRRGAGRSEE